MRARCPSSTSNLGPGFDVLSLALNLYVEVSATPSAALSIHAEGEGADLPMDGSHLCAHVAREVTGHDHFDFVVSSAIPVGRGLGSSAALAAATAAAIGASDPFAVAVGFDGHTENAAASVFGGLNAATMIDGDPVAVRLMLDEGLSFVVIVPDFVLSTNDARAVLAQQVAFSDAVSNLGRMGLLIAGLADRKQLVAGAGVDRLHQDARAALFPQAPELMAALCGAGAVVTCWSGAGPSLLGICQEEADIAAVCAAGERTMVRLGLPGRVMQLYPDLSGLVIED